MLKKIIKKNIIVKNNINFFSYKFKKKFIFFLKKSLKIKKIIIV